MEMNPIAGFEKSKNKPSDTLWLIDKQIIS
jgi:hypothetical protein